MARCASQAIVPGGKKCDHRHFLSDKQWRGATVDQWFQHVAIVA
jgi:hypothetical protein